ncbi:hypothetical protein HIM_08743 [Hirsutella minnesotensis 3608]|uniref:FAD-binding domain-containing protein n=1 Tax=Hirsutella minnesotensis 3608 TaxID=1043627 RepID=A0A0F7ZST0_9HYPO|nr:hypothetical protein HIM_08743 [Hirsutella minnesotensis 3608]
MGFYGRKPGYTDFIAAGGAGNHAWNVIRSEADYLLFKHAEQQGAKTFDKVKVVSIEFDRPEKHNTDAGRDTDAITDLGKPVSASWKQMDTGACGTTRFKYLVDASGRAGIVSTRYAKNREYNPGLKSTAIWGYWKSADTYGPGEGDPFFEAILDGSGWAWFIPLHDGTVSVGVTIKSALVAEKKKACGSTGTRDFYLRTLKDTPGIAKLLSGAQLQSERLRTASDWSYRAHGYAGPRLRIAGDAGCFIDPLFSSGVHLAMNSGLSAAVTICASLKGDCSEEAAMTWHSIKVAEGYTRFLLVVTSSLKQIHGRDKDILNDLDEPGFDTAFEHFKPIIQGTVEAGGKLTKAQIAQSVEFCTSFIAKVDSGCLSDFTLSENAPGGKRGAAAPAAADDVCDAMMMKIVRMNRVLDLDNFAADMINGMTSRIKRGHLGLIKGAG